MRKFFTNFSIITLVIVFWGSANAAILFSDDFETSWSGDYAPGWVNTAYRHGAPPVGQMMQQTSTSHTGNYGLKLIADSVPESWMWWAGVEVENLPHSALDKKYDPYVSVWHYDEMDNSKAGQMYAVPDWVNLYLEGELKIGLMYNLGAVSLKIIMTTTTLLLWVSPIQDGWIQV